MSTQPPASRTAAWPAGMPEVGQTAARTRRVQAQDIELFTRISGDRNTITTPEPSAMRVVILTRRHPRRETGAACSGSS